MRFLLATLTIGLLNLAMLIVLPLQASEKNSDQGAIILDDEDEDHESGFGIRLPWWGSKPPKPDKAVKQVIEKDNTDDRSPERPRAAKSALIPVPLDVEKAIILDHEDEDNESGFGIPIRFPGDTKSLKEDKDQGYEPVDYDSYRVVIDEEDEDNESGFGIPLPTEEDPTPWRRKID